MNAVSTTCTSSPIRPRPGTPAAKMPQVARDVVKARAAKLREKGAERLALRLDRHVGRTTLALVETGNRARLPDFSPVRIEGASPKPAAPPCSSSSRVPQRSLSGDP